MSLKISVDNNWLAGRTGPVEEQKTSAAVRIAVNDLVATRVYDADAETVRDRARLPLYHMAYWLAFCWWRLTYEPSLIGPPALDWRMSHELPAVGHGCLWPRIAFIPDGEQIAVVVRQSKPTPAEPIRYLEEFTQFIARADFEREVSSFVELVIKRLNSVDVGDSELHTLWREVTQERRQPDLFAFRKLEAALGYDPDEAPEDVLQTLNGLAGRAGRAAIDELAPACSGDNPSRTLARILQFAEAPGVDAKVADPSLFTSLLSDKGFATAPPWQRGRTLAMAARARWFKQADAISDGNLSDLLSIPIATFAYGTDTPADMPVGLAIRRPGADAKLKLLFRKRNLPARRFETARFLASSLIAPAGEAWLPSTDAKTALQKVQRAFAAEFLCPIDSLRAFLDGRRFDDDAIEDAAAHFGVSGLAIRSHLANNGDLVEDDLDDNAP